MLLMNNFRCICRALICVTRRVKVALMAVMIMKNNGMAGTVVSRDRFRDLNITCNIVDPSNLFSPLCSYSA